MSFYSNKHNIQCTCSSHSAPLRQDRTIGFYNHTVDGSRLIVNRYYFKPPADAAFCNIPFDSPAANAQPGSECGVNGACFVVYELRIAGF